MCRRLLSAVIICRLRLRLVPGGEEVLRKLTDELTPNPTAATGTVVSRRAMTARAAVCQAAEDLACKTAEIIRGPVVIAALLVAAQ